MEASSLIFITGGVRSGKSSYAEKTAIKRALKVEGTLNYIATGVRSDHEMEERIARHQKEREESPYAWKTWEKSTDIGSLAPFFHEKDVLLLDCLTTLLNNEFFSLHGDLDEAFLEEVFHRILSGIKAIKSSCNQLIIVSNEVLFEPFSHNEMVLNYYRMIGKLHQRLVELANQAYLVEAGVPILMKEGKQ